MSKWSEEHGNRRPEDYETPYEYRRHHLWKAYEDGMNVISYLQPPSFYRKLCRGVKKTVYQPPEQRFKILYEVDKALGQMQDLLFTKALTKTRSGKKVRKTLRKDIANRHWGQYDVYDHMALMHYLRQCKKEGAKKCLLSPKEFAILNPETKKQKREREINTTLKRKLIDY